MATSIPPHNAAELCDAALHLIDKPDAKSKSLLKWVKGPDFPTGGIVVDSKKASRKPTPPARLVPHRANGPGRGRARHLGRRHHRDPVAGAKSRLVEKIAELLNEKKLPLVGDVKDESAEDVRLVIEPKSRGRSGADDGIAVPADRAGKQDFAEPQRADQGQDPQGGGACGCLREWLDHLRDVLVRRSNFRKARSRTGSRCSAVT